MKNFNDLINESTSKKVTSDYNSFLLEKQYFITKKTVMILTEQEEDSGDPEDDENAGTHFRPHLGGKYFVHVDIGGKRDIKVVNTPQEAALIAQKYPGAVAYNFKGDVLDFNSNEGYIAEEDTRSRRGMPEVESDDSWINPWHLIGAVDSVAHAWRGKQKGNELNLNESLEDGGDRASTSSSRPRPQKKERTKAPMSAKMSKTYETLRAKLEKDIQANIADITDQEEQIVGKGKGNAESIKNSAFWKAVYDDPSLASVLDVEEYEKSGFRADEPLHIRKVGGHTYVPSREMDLSDLKPASRPYASGKATGPVNPEDVPDMKFIAPAHPSFEEKGGVEQAATKAGRWFEKPENIKTALSMGIGVGGALGLARAGLSAIPKVGPSIAPWLIGAGEVGLGGLYGMHVKRGIESEIEQAKKGKGVTVGQATAGQVAAELPVAAAGASVGAGLFKPRAPRPAELVEPQTKATKPESPKADVSVRWEIPGTKDYSAILRQQRERFVGEPSLEPATAAILRELPTSFGRESALAAKFKIGKDKVSMGEMTPGERINMWRNLFRYGPKGASKKTPMSALDKFELDNPLEAKPETFVEPQTPLAPDASSPGTAITLPKGFRGTQPKFVGFPFTPPAALPKRPSEFESPADYQRSKEENLGRALTDKEAKASAEEFAKDLREVEASRVSDRTTLFGDRGPVAMSSTGTPSRASVIARIQQSPITKAAGVMASVPTVADMAAREAATIPAIVARAIETTRTSAEPAGVIRTAYRELKAPEVKTSKPVETPKVETPSLKVAPVGYELMNQPADLSQLPDNEPVGYELMNQPMELPPSSDEEKPDSPVAVPSNRPKALPQPSVTPSTEAPTASQQSLLNAIKSARERIKSVSPKPSDTPDAIPDRSMDSVEAARSAAKWAPDIDRSMDSVEAARSAASWRAPEKSTVSFGTSGKPTGAEAPAMAQPKIELQKPSKEDVKKFVDLFKYQIGGDIQIDRSMDSVESARAKAAWKAPEKATVSFGGVGPAETSKLQPPKEETVKPSKEQIKKFADLFKYEVGGAGTPPDRSMDSVEAARAAAKWAPDIDRSMDSVEAARAAASWRAPEKATVSFGTSGKPAGSEAPAMEAPKTETQRPSKEDIKKFADLFKYEVGGTSLPPDRSMDSVEASRANIKWTTPAQAPVVVKDVEIITNKAEEKKNIEDTKKAEERQKEETRKNIDDAQKAIEKEKATDQQIQKAEEGRGGGEGKTEPPVDITNPSIAAAAGGLGSWPFGSDFGYEGIPFKKEAMQSGIQNWDLLMKHIYGKYAGTVSK